MKPPLACNKSICDVWHLPLHSQKAYFNKDSEESETEPKMQVVTKIVLAEK